MDGNLRRRTRTRTGKLCSVNLLTFKKTGFESGEPPDFRKRLLTLELFLAASAFIIASSSLPRGGPAGIGNQLAGPPCVRDAIQRVPQATGRWSGASWEN